MSEFSRPFRVVYSDGVIVHGVRFPNGVCVVMGSHGLTGATGFEHLNLPSDAVVEWADGGDENGPIQPPDSHYNNDGREVCNRCGGEVMWFKDGGWACGCPSRSEATSV